MAEQLPVALLSRLQHDPDWTVRHVVASRAAGETLAAMVDDPEPDVADCAARRWAVELTRTAQPAPQIQPYRKGVSA